MPRSLPLGAGDGHAFSGAHADQIRLELGECREDIEEHLPHRVGRVVDCGAESELHTFLFQLIGDGAGVRYGSCQSIELGYDQRVARPNGGDGLIQARSRTVGARQSVIRVDAILVHTELAQRLTLHGQVLAVG